MPVYNHYYPDSKNQINTPESAAQLARYGPVVPVTIGVTARHATILQKLNLAVPTAISGSALIDTGSTFCAVDGDVVKSLGIPQFGTASVYTPSGTAQLPTYPASLSFPGTTLPNITFADFMGSPLKAQGIIALIGRNVLMDFVLVYNGPGGFVSLTY
jgi:hypothetical protein